jgi:hypothetical protein
MQLARTIPRLGTLPQLDVFYCADCNEAETREEGAIIAEGACNA